MDAEFELKRLGAGKRFQAMWEVVMDYYSLGSRGS